MKLRKFRLIKYSNFVLNSIPSINNLYLLWFLEICIVLNSTFCLLIIDFFYEKRGDSISHYMVKGAEFLSNSLPKLLKLT